MTLRQHIFFLMFLSYCAILTGQQPASSAYSQRLVQNGVNVQLSVEPLATAGSALEEQHPVRVRFQLTDAATNSPVVGASPAAWIDRKPNGEKTSADQCTGKIKRFAEGSTFSRTELDLTSFYVVIMNDDPTLTVVDPRFGYGDTRLLALVQLDSLADDWALAQDGSRLFVSMPDANKVAVIDTGSWKVIARLEAGPHPGRLALQPDNGYLWVGTDANVESSGVSVVSLRDLKTVARIPTGRGYHQMAFSSDSSFAFVTNPADGTVSTIDVRTLARLKDIRVGSKPGSIAFSSLAQAAYVANEGDGAIVAIDGKGQRAVARMEAQPGLGQIRIAPDGRFAAVVNPANDHIYIIDTSSNRIVQTGKLGKEPDQISFTNKQIHVRHRGTDEVLMISLNSLGNEKGQLSVADFSGGRHFPGKMTHPTPADGLIQASGENGVLVANPGDKAVYFYMEGMAAPMGNFSNYGREPRAVLSVERNLRERAPGIYETTVKLPAAGAYDLAFLLDRPRVISCFDFPVAADPALAQLQPPKVHVEALLAKTAKAGDHYRIAFRVLDAETNKPKTDLKDLVVLMESPGIWQRRQVAQSDGHGMYAVDYIVPQPGIYLVFAASNSLGLNYTQYATVKVENTQN